MAIVLVDANVIVVANTLFATDDLVADTRLNTTGKH